MPDSAVFWTLYLLGTYGSAFLGGLVGTWLFRKGK